MSREPKVSLFDLSGKAIALAATAGGCLYVMGWSYASEFFKLWGIPLASLGIPRDYFLTYGLIAIQNQFLGFLLAVGLVVSGMAFLYVWGHGSLGKEGVSWALLTFFAAAFIASSYFGKWSAQYSYDAERRAGFIGFDRAIFLMKSDWLKDDASPRAMHLRKELKDLGCYRIIFIGSDAVWVARPFRGSETAASAEHPAVLGVPTRSIEGIRILSGRENCD
jgi:hypothetical protein